MPATLNPDDLQERRAPVGRNIRKMMTSGFYYQIRPAHFEELSQLAAIEQRAGMRFQSTAHAYVCSGPNVGLEETRERWRTGFVFVAVDIRDTIVGFALGGELSGEAFLQEIDVEPSHGRRGIGKKLIETTRDWAISRGFSSIVLSTFIDIPWNAPFYARFGFKRLAEIDVTPAMRKVRTRESLGGLALDRRIFMRLKC